MVLLLGSLANTSLAQSMFFNTANTQYQLTNTFSKRQRFQYQYPDQCAACAWGVQQSGYRQRDLPGDRLPGTRHAFRFSGVRFTTRNDRHRILRPREVHCASRLRTVLVLADGVQVEELVGNGVVLTFDGREVDNGRFHPALLELSADGTGRIQNSNNVPSVALNNELQFGERIHHGPDVRSGQYNGHLPASSPAAVAAVWSGYQAQPSSWHCCWQFAHAGACAPAQLSSRVAYSARCAAHSPLDQALAPCESRTRSDIVPTRICPSNTALPRHLRSRVVISTLSVPSSFCSILPRILSPV